MKRILICDDLAPVAIEVFRERGLEPEIRTGMDEAELIEAAREVDALVVRSATRVTRPVIEAATKLSVIGRAGVGVDNVDTEAATERGVVVMNTPTGNTTTTAELAIALLCALARHVPQGDQRVRGGAWSKKGLIGTEITGKTLGVIGLGRIGRAVAERALGLKLNVLAYDPYLVDLDRSPVAGVDLTELDPLLARSDFVSLHVPATEATRGLLSRTRIFSMKKGARLINAARGGIVDEIAVRDALDEKHLAGAAFDVLSDEPPGTEHPLIGRPDVILTPHMGASSAEAQHNVAVDVARQICDFLIDGVAHNAVNAPAVSAETRREIAPYVLLAEKMGAFLVQRLEEAVRKIELTVSGEIASGDHRYIPLALLVGALRASGVAGVNFVNAPQLAKERGIRILTGQGDEADVYHSYLKVRASGKGGEPSHLVAGTVFGRKPRFLRIDDMHLDLDPRGTLLVTRHEDRPGVVGSVGTVLGQHGVNIRRIELGPPSERSTRGLASGFFALDEAPAVEAVRALEEIEAIREVSCIEL